MAETEHLDQTIEAKIGRLRHMRDDIRRIEAEIKGLKGMFTALQMDVMDHMDEQGVTKIGTSLATVSISEEEMPTVDAEEWPAVFDYLFENDYKELLRRQINSTPWKELKRLGIDIPHVTTFTKRKLNLRSVAGSVT